MKFTQSQNILQRYGLAPTKYTFNIDEQNKNILITNMAVDTFIDKNINKIQ